MGRNLICIGHKNRQNDADLRNICYIFNIVLTLFTACLTLCATRILDEKKKRHPSPDAVSIHFIGQ